MYMEEIKHHSNAELLELFEVTRVVGYDPNQMLLML